MNDDQLRSIALEELAAIAPEVDPATIVASKLLRDQLDLDSMDWLRFHAALEKRLSVSIPDSAARKLLTLDDIVRYLVPQRHGPEAIEVR